MQQTDYRDVIRALRTQLPPEAFRPYRGDLGHIAAHFAICGLGYGVMLSSEQPWVWALVSLVLGHSIFCLGNLAHMLTHRAILKSRSTRYPLEVFSWAMAFIPATIWRITHNQNHHRHTNARGDAFYSRRFTPSECSKVRSLYITLFFPNRQLVGNPLVLTAMLPFIAISTYVAFVSGEQRPESDNLRYQVSSRETS